MSDDQERRCILSRAEQSDRPHRPMPDALICAGHDSQIRGYLVELVNYPAALTAAVAAETTSVKLNSVMVGGSTEERMPIGEDRADHLLDIHDKLWLWASNVADYRSMHRPDLSDIWVTARFLARHQLWIVTQDIVTDYHSELRELVTDARRFLNPSKGPNRSQLPCPLTDSEGCTGVLASLPTPDDDEQMNTACDCCGFVLSPGQFRTYKRQLRKRLDPDVPEAPDLVNEADLKLWALATGIPDATLRSWLHRGELVKLDVDGRGLFDLDKADELAKRRKANKDAA